MEKTPKNYTEQSRQKLEDDAYDLVDEAFTTREKTINMSRYEEVTDSLVAHYLNDHKPLHRAEHDNALIEIARRKAREILAWEERMGVVEKVGRIERTKKAIKENARIAVLNTMLGLATGSAIGAEAAGYVIVPEMADTDISAVPEKTEEQKTKKRDLTEMNPEMTQEFMDELIQEVLPGSWTRNIGNIGYHDSEKAMPSRYGTDGTVSAEAEVNTETGRTDINIYKKRDGDASSFLEGSFLHEVGHGNDFDEYNENFPDDFRKKMAEAIAERLDEPDRFKSGYLDSIRNENENEKEKILASEYWAEIIEQYLKSERPEQELKAEDIRIIEAVISANDPGFDRRVSWKKLKAMTSRVKIREFSEKASEVMASWDLGLTSERMTEAKQDIIDRYAVDQYREYEPDEHIAEGQAAFSDLLEKHRANPVAEKTIEQLMEAERLNAAAATFLNVDASIAKGYLQKSIAAERRAEATGSKLASGLFAQIKSDLTTILRSHSLPTEEISFESEIEITVTAN